MNIARLINNGRFVVQPLRKPLLLKNLVRSYAMYATHRAPAKRPLRNVDIALDYACNLACEHCSCATFERGREKMTEADLSKIHREAVALGGIYFAFTGGEPLLNKNLEDVIQLFNPRGNLIGVQTNALLLTPQRARSLYKAGLDAIQVSLDSGTPEEHDTFRNMPGAHKKTLEHVAEARKAGIQVIFSSTLTHSSLRSQSQTDLLDFAKSQDIPVVVSVPCPVGRWAGNLSEQFTEDDRKYLEQLQRKYPFLRRDFHSNYVKKGCTAGTEKLYITPYGDVIPCPFIHISFGNIKKEPLADIRARMLRVDDFNTYSQICLAGEDNDFIDAYIRPTYSSQAQPVCWDDHENLKHLDDLE